MTATTKPELGECPLTASHTRRACDNGGSCWCIEHPEEVAQINAHPEVIEARSAATTELRALLTQGAVHDPPWNVADDHGTPYIRGKHGPGWYDCVAEEVSNEETAALIVAAVNALPAILDLLDELRAGYSAFYEGDKSRLLNAEAMLRAL